MAVTKGGNHLFGHVIGASGRGLPEFKIDAFKEALDVFQDDILSDIYIGWVKGYLDDERKKVEAFIAESGAQNIQISHPRDAFRALAEQLRKAENQKWLE
jgi:CRISPR-associated protein Cst2